MSTWYEEQLAREDREHARRKEAYEAEERQRREFFAGMDKFPGQGWGGKRLLQLAPCLTPKDADNFAYVMMLAEHAGQTSIAGDVYHFVVTKLCPPKP